MFVTPSTKGPGTSSLSGVTLRAATPQPMFSFEINAPSWACPMAAALAMEAKPLGLDDLAHIDMRATQRTF